MSNAAIQQQQPTGTDVLDAKDEQSLTQALRTGDRDTIEAIVQKLSGQLETLKNESFEETKNQTNSNAQKQQMKKKQQQRQKKRFTQSMGDNGIATPVVCAYCGTNLDDGPATSVSKANLANEIGYCCVNCESILSETATNATAGPLIHGGSDEDGYFDAPEEPSQKQQQQPEQKNTDCDKCGQPVGEEYVNVLGRRFHTTHFVCEDCGIPLYALGGYLQDPSGVEKFYCQRDFLQRFSVSCHACSVQITSGEMAVALGRTYHSDCFVCSICQSPFIGDVCYEHDGQPLCEWHWYIQNGLLCPECGGVIKNKCVYTRGKRYHQACAESKYGATACTLEEAHRQIKGTASSSATSSTVKVK